MGWDRDSQWQEMSDKMNETALKTAPRRLFCDREGTLYRDCFVAYTVAYTLPPPSPNAAMGRRRGAYGRPNKDKCLRSTWSRRGKKRQEWREGVHCIVGSTARGARACCRGAAVPPQPSGARAALCGWAAPGGAFRRIKYKC